MTAARAQVNRWATTCGGLGRCPESSLRLALPRRCTRLAAELAHLKSFDFFEAAHAHGSSTTGLLLLAWCWPRHVLLNLSQRAHASHRSREHALLRKTRLLLRLASSEMLQPGRKIAIVGLL
jgi:hypothetical protein